MTTQINSGYYQLLSFKKGGTPRSSAKSSIPDEKKKELFPYFAYIYSKQLNPEKYGQVSSMEEWTNLIQNSKEDIDAVTKAASQLSDEEWASVDEQYQQAQAGTEMDQAQFAKKGAKLKKLKDKASVSLVKPPIPESKKGGKVKSRKCSCGCDLVLSKGKGGKLSEKCSCNCGGGKLKKKK